MASVLNMSVTQSTRGHFSLVFQALERAMKFSYNELHVWYQFALSLIETGKVSLN